MSKTIWLRDNVYQELDSLRAGRETFGDIIMRLIRVFRAIQRVPYAQSGDDFFKEEPKVDARAKKTLDAIPNRPEVPYM